MTDSASIIVSVPNKIFILSQFYFNLHFALPLCSKDLPFETTGPWEKKIKKMTNISY